MEIGQVVKDRTDLHAVDRRLTSDRIVQLETEKMGKYIMQMWSQGGQERLCGFETMLAPGEVITLGTAKTAITKGATATEMLYTGELQILMKLQTEEQGGASLLSTLATSVGLLETLLDWEFSSVCHSLSAHGKLHDPSNSSGHSITHKGSYFHLLSALHGRYWRNVDTNIWFINSTIFR